MKSSKKIVVLGGGISGVSTAFLLLKRGYDVHLLEKAEETGGFLSTVKKGMHIFENGTSFAVRTNKHVDFLLQEAKLEDKIIEAGPAADQKYIYRGGEFHRLPYNTSSFLKSNLISKNSKFRAFTEPSVSRSKEGEVQSVSQFIRRRLGDEMLDYAFDPLVSETYAGDPEQLAVESAFPRLYELEKKFGGLVMGTIKSLKMLKNSSAETGMSGKVFTLQDGLQSLTAAMAVKMGSRVTGLADVEAVTREGEGYRIDYNNAGRRKSMNADVVISALPAYAAAKAFKGFAGELAERLESVYYPPLLVINAVFKRQFVSKPFQGYGILFPAKEKKKLLSVIFPQQVFGTPDADYMHIILRAGGARQEDLFTLERDRIIKGTIIEARELLGIAANPEISSSRFWTKSIPQYGLDHAALAAALTAFEEENKGIHITGNYRDGVSFSDAIRNAYSLADSIEAELGTGPAA